MDEKRIAVTLTNGRSHILRVPDSVATKDAVSVVRGVARGVDVGWEAGESEWLACEQGDAWVQKATIAEIAIVDYPSDPSTDFGYPY